MTSRGGSAGEARRFALLVAAAFVFGVVVLIAGCTGTDAGAGTEGGSDGGIVDLPGPLPSDVSFRKPPRGALAAPDFSVVLLDGTSVTASDLWDDRPLVLLFTDSSCDACADVHREVADTVSEHDGAIALLVLVREDDIGGAREFAEDQQLNHPIGIGDERVWLNYAAEEPPLVVLVAPGGKVLRGWPGGADAGDLDAQLDELYVKSPSEDE